MDDLSLSIIAAQIINFWILFFIFKHFLWESIVKAIEERRRKLKSLENSDDVVKAKLAEAALEAKKITEDARKNAQELQQKNDELIKKNTEIKLSEADKKAEAILEAATRDVEKEKWSMLEEMKNKVLDLSLKINWKVFWDSSKNKEFIEKEVNSVKV